MSTVSEEMLPAITGTMKWRSPEALIERLDGSMLMPVLPSEMLNFPLWSSSLHFPAMFEPELMTMLSMLSSGLIPRDLMLRSRCASGRSHIRGTLSSGIVE